MARDRQGGWSGKVTAITNAKLKEAMKIMLKGTKVQRINMNYKKQARVTK